MAKILLQPADYTFDASAKTVAFDNVGTLDLENVLLITNLVDGIIIYNFADPAKSGTVATNVLTLEFDTTSMSDTDALQIFYNDPTLDTAGGPLVNLGANNDVTVTSLPALPTGSNNIGDVDVLSSALPTGAATSANQTTEISSLQSIDSDMQSASASLDLLDDTVAVLGTATYTEATTKGLIIGAVRRDADTTLVNTTNEITPLQVDANGRLKVEVFSGETLPVSLTSTTVTGTVAVTQSGTWDEVGINDSGNSITVDAVDLDIRNLVAATDIVDLGGNALTSLQLIDDVVYTDDTSTHATGTSKGVLMMAAATPTDTAVNANDIAALAMTVNRELLVQVNTALPAGTNNIGDVDVLTLPTLANVTTVATVTNVSQQGGVAISLNTGVRDSGTQRVTIATNDVVPVTDNSGSLTVDAPIGTPVNVQLGNATLVAGVIDETGAAAVDALAVGGGTAHDAVDSGNPIKIGGVAVSGSATPTSVAAADRVRFIANQHGIPYGIGGHPNLITREYDFGTAAQTDVNLAAAVVAADERIYVTRFEALCDNANTVAVSVRAGFGTASVPTASATGVSGMIASHPGIAAGSGIMSGNGAGILAVGAAGEEPRLTSSAATTGNLHVIISYFLIDETP